MLIVMTDARIFCFVPFLGRLLSVITAADNGSLYRSRYCEKFTSKKLVASDVTSAIHCGALSEMVNGTKFQYDQKNAKCYKGTATVATSTNDVGMMVNKLSMSSCQSNYDLLPFTNMCIRLSNKKITWLDADSDCKGQGANLVSIPCSYVETAIYDYIDSKGLSTERVWIGLNDKTTEGKFVWSNGQPVTYTNWASIQPDNYGGAQDFGLLIQNRKGWDDNGYSQTYYSICSTYI